MKKIYADEQIVGFIREADKTDVKIDEFCWQKGFNEGTSYKWKLEENYKEKWKSLMRIPPK